MIYGLKKQRDPFDLFAVIWENELKYKIVNGG